MQGEAASQAKAQPAGEHISLEADGSAASSKKKRKRPSQPAQATVPTQLEDSQAGTAVDEAEPEVKRGRRATHVGRFKRREAGKRVRHYASDDLTAILGGQPQAGAAGAADGVGSRAAAERAASPETPSASEPPKPTSSDLPRLEGAFCK